MRIQVALSACHNGKPRAATPKSHRRPRLLESMRLVASMVALTVRLDTFT